MTRHFDAHVHPCAAIVHVGIVRASGQGLGALHPQVASPTRERSGNACRVTP